MDLDYNGDQVRDVAVKTLRLMRGERKWEFPVAFSIAFRESSFDPELAHCVKIGVKSFFRFWKEEKKKRESLAIPGIQRSVRV